MKTYERHCALFQSSVGVTIKQSLKRCIENEIVLTKFVLTSSENSRGDMQPVSLTPLLRTIRDERYMLGKELCIWGIQLSNQDIANLALLLELDGRTTYPFCSLEIIHTVIDAWSVERLGVALPVSNLRSIVLDYTNLIKYSEHLIELDLDGNAIGELCSADILDALKERLNEKMPNLNIKVTYQISSETFGSIFKNGKKSKSTRKKKKKTTK
ncbi:hypothetical protein Y1Q_0024516 [Alligator mississippiensis]|uniref:Uncharacterized protein n=1 Tax=Alligator mississippiensis TaxID=8496 RepID=A0A151NAN7_ALLMI|nr:hypothetical protein Y1Q_0024516 [Alligator mississippiensis]